MAWVKFTNMRVHIHLYFVCDRLHWGFDVTRLLIEEMETNGVVDLTLNSHDMDRCDEGLSR